MHLPTGIAKKIYLIITMVITIPMLFFAYFDALRLKDLLLEQKGKQLLEVASVLEHKLEGSFDEILAKERATSLSKDEQVKILNKHLQPLVMEVAKLYPGYGLGFYHRQLNTRVAIGPNFRPERLRPASNPKILQVYQTGKIQIIEIEKSVTWNGKSALSATYPIYRQGKIIGHTWGNTKTEDIQREFLLLLAKNILSIFLIWLVVMVIIWWSFKRLQLALSTLAVQIEADDYHCNNFKDFPELLPLFKTIIRLREKLKKESNLLRWVVETIPGAIIAINQHGKIILANPGTYKSLGLNEKNNNLIGCDFSYISELVGNQDSEKAPLIQALKHNRTFYRANVCYKDEKIYQYDAAPILDPQSGEKLGAACYIHDISEEEKTRLNYLNESQKLQQLIDSLPIALIAVDTKEIITALNATATDYFPQFTKANLIGQPFELILKMTGAPSNQVPILRALKGETISSEQLSVFNKSFLINAYPIKDVRSQKISGAVCLYTDVTTTKEAEERIKKQAQLLDLAQDYIFVRDLVNKITFWSKGAEIGYGWRKEEALGKSSYELLKTKFSKPIEEIETELLEKDYWVGEVIQSRKNGTKVVVESRWALQRNSQGEPESILVINHDITQLKENQKKEQQLITSYINEAEKLKQLIELCPLAILVINKQGEIITANQACLSYNSKFTQEQIIGLPYKTVTAASGLDYEKTAIVRALKGEQIKGGHSNFADRQLLIHALPIRDAQTGVIMGAMSIYDDITEHEQIRAEMSRLDSLNLIGEMAASVAHEVRNPMTAARGYLQLIMAKSGGEFEKQFKIVLEELDRANSIISDFLSLARDKSAEKKEQNLNDIIMTISPLIYGDAIKKEISVKLELAEGLPVHYFNDREIKQLILNFSRNAIEAMKQKGCLTITTKKEASQLQLSITDTGCGIPKEQLDKIFDPFYTTKNNGTGLGLGVCLGIIKRHQGVIDVKSREGKGTTFTITFDTANPCSIDQVS